MNLFRLTAKPVLHGLNLGEATRLVDAGKRRWAWNAGKLVLVEPDHQLGPDESFLRVPSIQVDSCTA
jgi:hypothetical protein